MCINLNYIIPDNYVDYNNFKEQINNYISKDDLFVKLKQGARDGVKKPNNWGVSKNNELPLR